MSDHDLLPLYALDSLPDDERIAFDAHLGTCELCQRELASYGPTLQHLADAVEVEPNPDLKVRVMAQIPDVEQEPAPSPGPAAAPDGPDEVAPVVPLGARRRDRGPAEVAGRWMAVAAAILAFAVVTAGTIGIVLWGQNTRLEQQTAQLEQRTAELEQQLAEQEQDQQLAAVLAAPDARLVDVQTELSGNLRVAVSDSLGEGIVVADDLEAPPDDRAYQLWLIDDGTPRSAGVVQQTSGVLGVLPQVGGAEALAVSIEPPSGSDAPSGPIVGQAPLQ